jgi:hypothetical protein
MESELNFWFPVMRIQHSARSSQGYTFGRAAMGRPIISPTPYSFAGSLIQQNEIVLQRKDFDPVYRGDVRTMAPIPLFLMSTSPDPTPGFNPPARYAAAS